MEAIVRILDRDTLLGGGNLFVMQTSIVMLIFRLFLDHISGGEKVFQGEGETAGGSRRTLKFLDSEKEVHDEVTNHKGGTY